MSTRLAVVDVAELESAIGEDEEGAGHAASEVAPSRASSPYVIS